MKRHSSLTLLLLAALSLSACEHMFDAKKPKVAQHKTAKTAAAANTSSSEYITGLSLARFSLATAPEDTDAALAQAQPVKSYHSRTAVKIAAKGKKPAKEIAIKPDTLTVAVIDYKTKTGFSSQTLMAPVSKKSGYASLKLVLDKMQASSATLKNIRLVSVTVTPDNNFALPEDATLLKTSLDSQQQQIMSHSHTLSLIDDLRAELDLLAFFIDQKYQDAAYLTLDNAKRELANATQDKSLDEAAINGFSTRLGTLENTLKTAMPYKL